MFPFAKLNPDADTLIDVLGLHFDADIVLGNRLSPTQEAKMYSHASQEVTENISEDQPSAVDDFSVVEEKNSVQEFTMDVREHQWQEEDSLASKDAFDSISLSEENITDEFKSAPDLETEKDFSGMSFETVNLTADNEHQAIDDFNLSDENGLDDLNQPDESEFRDVISDVWGDDSSLLEEGEENNNLLGEELPSEVFDESEMARLFPNNINQ
ncbi:hypothetical protein SR1949_38470 [Sphaerospermopsis reniformis]|uniref:Uncharacterized protein n=2 Tax=Sphaerospermopsis reniformis TaxID=531300 RepID=A0A480A5W7_9CYAN|nr:hypothetical protein SR1949_38470 [Sphaerospermopsis reniformis]